MRAMKRFADLENAALKRRTEFGGSSRYPEEVLSKECVETYRTGSWAHQDAARSRAHQDAKEHIAYCVLVGMAPEDISLSLPHDSERSIRSWGDAFDLVESVALEIYVGGVL